MLKLAFAAAAAIALAAPASAFEIGFSWDGLKSCTSGNPNTVANPRFVLKDVPEGTKFIRFKLVDTNVREFNHGGGVVAYTGQDVVLPAERRPQVRMDRHGTRQEVGRQARHRESLTHVSGIAENALRPRGREPQCCATLSGVERSVPGTGHAAVGLGTRTQRSGACSGNPS